MPISPGGAEPALPATAVRDARFCRAMLRAAALYNFAFLAWAVLAPGQFFALIGAAGGERFHWLWQCVGMVVGVYGFLYWHAADHLAEGRAIVAVGLLGKVLGPLGWGWTFAHGGIAAPSFLVIAANDLVWWPGFAAFLLAGAGLRAQQRVRLLVLLLAHAAGAVLLGLAAWPPAALGSDRGRAVCWTIAWAVWCTADVFSPPFVRALLLRHAPASADAWRRWLGPLIVAAAVLDLALNARCAALETPDALAAGGGHEVLRALSLTVSNGLFLLAYASLSWLLWRGGRLPRSVVLLPLPAWAGALGLCLAGVGVLPAAEPLCGGVLAVSFCVWLLALWRADG